MLLEGSKIRAVGAVNEVAAPEGAPVDVHDFPEATILPGLVDVHTHLNYPGDGTHTDDVMAEEDDILLMQSIVNARSYLAKGVTTIRDNGAKNYTTLSLKKGIARGLATGPRLSICVNPLTITGGHMWQMGAEADGVDEVVKGVRRLVKLGADYIKVAVTGGTTKTSDRNRAAYNLDELKAIVDEAHKFGRLVAGHAHASAGIVNCLDSGIDMIIHCSWNDADGGSTIRPDVVERIAETGSWVNPTLDQVFGAPREKLQEKADTVGLNATERQAGRVGGAAGRPAGPDTADGQRRGAVCHRHGLRVGAGALQPHAQGDGHAGAGGYDSDAGCGVGDAGRCGLAGVAGRVGHLGSGQGSGCGGVQRRAAP